MNKFNQKVLFYGTPHFAVEALELLINNNINLIGVVTAPDRKAGRGQNLRQSEVKKWAIVNDIPVYQPINLKSEEFNALLESIKPDVQVVIAFRMLPEKVWNFPKMGTYNVHASILPNYRGAAPINWCLYNGEKVTGVTSFKLKHEIDTGDIALVMKLDIDITDNFLRISRARVIPTYTPS